MDRLVQLDLEGSGGMRIRAIVPLALRVRRTSPSGVAESWVPERASAKEGAHLGHERDQLRRARVEGAIAVGDLAVLGIAHWP